MYEEIKPQWGEPRPMDGFLPLKFFGCLAGLVVGVGLGAKACEIGLTIISNWPKVSEFYQSLSKGGGF